MRSETAWTTSSERGAGSPLDHHRNAPRFFYGWTVVAAVFVILMVTSGLGFYNASVILSAGADELDVSVGAVSGATAVFFVVSGLTGFLLSRQMDTRDLRYFYVVGALLGASALGSLRWVDTIEGFYAFFAVFGIGFALAGLVPSTTLVTRWFARRRSIALSIASTGLSLGGIAVTPLSTWMIDRRGLGGAGPYLGLAWLVGVVPIGVLLIRSHPSDLGLEPDGDEPADARGGRSDPGQAAAVGATFVRARRTRFFVFMCATYALIFFAQVGGLAHLFNLASERVDKTTAGTALSVLALTSVVGRLVGGIVVLRIPTKVLSVALALAQVGALISMAYSTSAAAIIGSAVLLGVSVGNLLMLQPLLLAEAFGVVEYSRIYSFNQLISTLGVGGGPFVLGLVHDVSDYRIAFLVAAAASLLGFLTFVLAGPTEAPHAIWD